MWIRWMETAVHEQERSQSRTAPGFSEMLHDTSLGSCEANRKSPPSRRVAPACSQQQGASGQTGVTRLEAEHWLLSAETKSSLFS